MICFRALRLCSVFGCAALRLEANGDAVGREPRVQLRQHATRLDMAFFGEEQRLAEAAVERGLQRVDGLDIETLMMRRQPCEALEVGAIARVRYYQRTVEWCVRHFLAP